MGDREHQDKSFYLLIFVFCIIIIIIILLTENGVSTRVKLLYHIQLVGHSIIIFYNTEWRRQ